MKKFYPLLITFLMKKAIYLFLFLSLSKFTTAQNWVALGSGMNAVVYEFVIYNGELYAGGDFTIAGGNAANRVAKWDGTEWSALGAGIDDNVFELRIYNGQLYAAGLFSNAGGAPASNIARWDGTSWSEVGSGTNGSVNGSVIHNGELYVCGNFTTAGGISANRVAKWDGTTWSAVGDGMNGFVRGLFVYNAEIYAGGDFTTADGNTANRMAKWNGSMWSEVGGGMDNSVFDALTIYNSDLCVGGTFTAAGGNSVNRLAKWNGTTWSDVGGGVTGASVRDVAVFNDELVVGGSFSMAGGLSVGNIAKWDGTSWSTFGSGMNNFVQTLFEFNSELYAGGQFTTAGGTTVNRVAKWETCDLPSQPGPISGTTTVCSGSSQMYSVSAVPGATTYTWTLPSGWTGSSTTTSITATVGANSGNISVTANNSCGSSTAETLAVTVNTTPAQPGTISGNNTVCQSSSQIYSISAVPGATTYTWTLPSGWTGSSTTTSITATVGASSGNISVTANNNCGSSPAQTLAVTVVNSVPAQPGAINGSNSVCQGSSQTYTISVVSGATSYTWTLPSGWTGTSTTTSITATVGANNGNISVTANNICGSSIGETLEVTVNTTPTQPGPISGNNSVCQGSSQTYSINAVNGATTYTWTLPSGWTGSSTTTSVTATVGANSGNISVTANNSCGSSSAQMLAVTVNPVPAQPGAISGNNAVCQDSSQTYSISAVSGAISYTWSLPSGWTGSSTTTSITATVGANGGNISVTANNSCGSSTAQTLAVTVYTTPEQPGPISGNNSVCLGSSQTYSISAVSGATTYTWTLPSGWTGTSTTTFLTATVGASGGNISVIANNSCDTSTAQTLAVSIINAVPAQPGTISGNNSVCQTSSQIYSIDSVGGATSYTWSLPSGWTGTSTTTSITATVGASGGNISIIANNNCGSSPAQNLAVTVSPVPAQPDTINGNNVVCQGSSQAYSISEVSDATSYSWTLPSGWTGSSTTSSITVAVGVSSGDISVTANNSCGSGPAQILAVTVNPVPAQPDTISGNIAVCQDSSQTYSISAISDATSYTWTLPSGWTGSSTTTSITATVGANSGNISATANNSCGSGPAQTLAVTVNTTPAQPGTISGNNSVCQGSSQTYSISAVSGATTYTWTLPSGWTGISTTTLITTTVGTSDGNISVTAHNSCDSSTAQTLALSVINSVPVQPDTISGNNSVCQTSSQIYSIDFVGGATSYTWSLPSGWTGTSTTTSISASVGSNDGIISVTANNSCGSSTAQILPVSVNPVPAQPGAISGNTMVTVGETLTYSISPANGATGYNWSLSGGGNITVGMDTISISVNWLTAGNYVLAINATNSCGMSSNQTLNITVSLGTGVDDPDNPLQIKINPNPSQEEFYLTANGVINKVIFIQVFSLSGQLIYSSEQRAGTNNISQLLNLSHVAVGVYIVNIRIDKNKYSTTIARIN